MKTFLPSCLIILSCLGAEPFGAGAGIGEKDGWTGGMVCSSMAASTVPDAWKGWNNGREVSSPSQVPDTLKAYKDTLTNRAQLQPLVQTDLSLPQVVPPSPAAIEISKGINYPADLASGLVRIEIPLYEIVDGDIHIPIVLTYHPSGLMPGVHCAAWLPQGWSLSVGPTLSRSIAGGPDELVYDPIIAASSSPTRTQLEAVASQTADIALDKFQYSLPGHSGQLYLSRIPSASGTGVTVVPVTVPSEPIAVSLPGGPSDLNSVILTDPYGNLYSFGGSSAAFFDKAYVHFGGAALYVPTSWKIREIRSKSTGRAVSFQYFAPITETVHRMVSDAVTMIDSMHGQVTYNAPVVYISSGSGQASYYIYNADAPGKLTQADPLSLSLPAGYVFPATADNFVTQDNSYPSSISFSGGTVQFKRTSTGTGTYSLALITVKDLYGNTVRKISFTQTASVDGELTLHSVTVSGQDAAEGDLTWSFSYNGAPPPWYTRDIDRWGYYNAAGNTSLVPSITTEVTVNGFPFLSQTDTVTIPGGNREPDEEAMKQGILASITYPTGGKADLSYEAHRYKDPLSGKTRLAGGLRVKHILETDPSSGDSLFHRFHYGDSSFRRPLDASGRGILAVQYASAAVMPDSLEAWYRETSCHEFQAPATLRASYKERIWTDNSMVPVSTAGGSSVLYPFVMETLSDHSGRMRTAIQGSTLHAFNVAASHPIKVRGTTLVADSRNAWTKGEEVSSLALKADYDNAFPMDAESISFGYTLRLRQDQIKTGQVYKAARVYGTDETLVQEQYKQILHIWSLPVSGCKLLSSRTVTSTESNGTLSVTETFAYDSLGNVSLKTASGSRSFGASGHPLRITRYSYPGDIHSPVGDAMEAAGMVSVPVRVEEFVSRNGSPSSMVPLSTLATTYKAVTTGTGSFTSFVPASVSLSIDAPPSDIGAPSSGTRSVSFDYYDSRGNPMQRTGLDDMPEVLLWGYRGQYPVAKVTGTSLSAVLAAVDTAILNTGTASQVTAQLASLRSAFATSPAVHVETFTWSPLKGVAAVTDPSGKSVAYSYDGLGRLAATYAYDGTAERLLEEHSYKYNPSTTASGRNFFRTRNMLSSSGTAGPFTEKTVYADALARTIEKVDRCSSLSLPSLVSVQQYDSFGRPASLWRPMAMDSNNEGGWVTPSYAMGRAFVTYLDVYADSFSDYENSPRSRVTAEHGPGSPWRTRSKYTKTEYNVNTSTHDGQGRLDCPYYYPAVTQSGEHILRRHGLYAAGELRITWVTDEDGNLSGTFHDKWGQKVLERRFTDGDGDGGTDTFVDTFYVTDSLGLLRYVIPPMAAAAMQAGAATAGEGGADGGTVSWADSAAVIRDYVFVYRYDSRARNTYRKLPGREPQFIRYDRADRVTFTQDGVQRASGLWTFTLRDTQGRECVRATGAAPDASIASVAATAPVVTFTTSPGGTALGGYVPLDFTAPAGSRLLEASYYDSYSFLSLLPYATAQQLTLQADPAYGTAWPSNASPDAKGLLTGRRIYLLGDGTSYSAESVYYDWRSAPVQTHSVDHRGIVSDTYLALSFTGNVTASREEVTVPATLSSTGSAVSTVSLKAMSYDAWDRLTEESTTVGDGTAAGSVSDVMSFSYDAVGRMIGRTYGSGSGAVAETLSYDVRDHLTGQSSSAFSSTLRYTDPSRTAITGKYDGSISEWTWSRGAGSTAQTYAFSYDGLARLTGTKRYTGSSTTATDAFTERDIAYDRNGNITALKRFGASASAAEDDLAFTLSGNRIASLANSGTNGSGVTFSSFTYDANGNTTHDGRTGQGLSWNMLNLISGISTTSGGNPSMLASYSWYADGTKYSAERPDGSGYVYKGSLVFEKDANGRLGLDAALTTGGRIVADRDSLTGAVTGYTVYHHITDHLGSVRAVVYAGGTASSVQAGISPGAVVETSDYLPYGTRWSQTGGSSSATITDAANRWRYSGKEEQAAINPTLPLIDYGARMYDPTIARWTSADPMAEKYYQMSPYGYCAGNPVNVVDPRGDSLLIKDPIILEAIYNGLLNRENISIRIIDGVVDPSSLEPESDDFFMRDLYEIASCKQTVELSLGEKYSYINEDGIVDVVTFERPYDSDESTIKYLILQPGDSEKRHINGILGRVLFPVKSSSMSTSSNIQIIINSLGNLNHRTVGVAHEFGHVILFLHGLPYRHQEPGVDSFVYDKRATPMSQRLGYDP